MTDRGNFSFFFRVLCVTALAATYGNVLGQERGPDQDLVTQTQVDEFTSRVESATDLTDEQKTQALAAVQQAADALQAAADFNAEQQLFTDRLAGLSDRRDELTQSIAQLQRTVAESPGVKTDVLELEQQLAEKQRDLADAQAELTKTESRIEERTGRLKTLRDRLAAIPALEEQIAADLAILATSSDPALLSEARRIARTASRHKLAVEPAAIQAELAWMEAQDSTKILTLERQLATERITRRKAEVKSWTDTIAVRRRTDAQERQKAALRAADATVYPLLQDYYRETAEIVVSELAIRGKLQVVDQRLGDTVQQREDLDEDWKLIRRRESRVGASRSFGVRLRQQRRELPSTRTLRAEIYQRLAKYEDVQLTYLDWREDRRELDDLAAAVSAFPPCPDWGEIVSDEEQDDRVIEIRAAMELRRAELDEVIHGYEDYIEALDQFDYEQESLIDLTDRYAAYIDQRILWIRSHEPLTFESVLDDDTSLRNLTGPWEWTRMGTLLVADVKANPSVYVLALVVALILSGTHRIQRRALQETAKQAASRLNTSIQPTNRALLWTLIKSCMFPVPVLFLAWRVTKGAPSDSLARLAETVRSFSMGVLCLEFIRNVCRPNGLGPKHFAWTQRVNGLINRHVRLFFCLGIPLIIVMSILQLQRTENASDALERCAFVVLSCLLVYMMHRLTSRRSGVVREWTELHPSSWLSWVSRLIHVLAVGIPIALAGLTIAGYGYAADELGNRLALTLPVVFGAVFIRSYLMRGIVLRQRRLAIEQVRAARAATQTASEGTSNLPEVEGDRNTVAQVGEQTKRLLNTTIGVLSLIVLYGIWVDVFPALGYFDQWKLPGTEVGVPTLAGAILMIVLTGTASRNVPGFLEILLLERLPLDRSVRYAVSSITQYLIILIGILIVSKILGIDWNQVQWLAAALTVGLGFGLQEIFANFVSGIIILFEQPVRVGDIVTIDGVSGVVSRIRIRSTTITDWDRKEYIVPNKEFITGRLLNWTLTDTINRVMLNVGVSYSADPQKTQEVILTTVTRNETVLSDPPPMVTFESFGDSALNFVVRAYLPNLENRLLTVHQLHSAIHHALGAAGIEIPFPQRDLHLRSVASFTSQEELLRELGNGTPHSPEQGLAKPTNDEGADRAEPDSEGFNKKSPTKFGQAY